MIACSQRRYSLLPDWALQPLRLDPMDWLWISLPAMEASWKGLRFHPDPRNPAKFSCLIPAWAWWFALPESGQHRPVYASRNKVCFPLMLLKKSVLGPNGRNFWPCSACSNFWPRGYIDLDLVCPRSRGYARSCINNESASSCSLGTIFETAQIWSFSTQSAESCPLRLAPTMSNI